jgi:hypothetical protein
MIAPALPKLRRLIPRLATDADGEIIATVRAIRRVLAAEGLDLHDLADAIDARPPYPDDAFIRGAASTSPRGGAAS